MAPSTNTRTIRFSDEDMRDIDKFLSENRIFDFSTLARVAIREFIENPVIEIKGIGELDPKKKKRREVTQ